MRQAESDISTPGSIPRSIGAKLTLRYTAVLTVTLTAVAVFVYVGLTQRVNREARLLVEVQARELAEALRSQQQEHPPEHVLRWLGDHLDRIVAEADPSLGLGVELLGPGGERVLAAGSLSGEEHPPERSLLDGTRDEAFRAVNLGGELAHLAMVVRVDGGFLRVAIATARYADNVAYIRRVFLLALPLVLLLSAGAGWVLARSSLRPIRSITRTARRISGSNLNASVPLSGSGDELDELAATLNDMLERIQDSVERMRRFNANAAHELRTPLAAISNEVEVTVEQERSPDEYRKVLFDVLERVRALAEGLDAMLRLARSEAGLDPAHRTRVALGPMLDTVQEFFSPLAEEGRISLAWEGPLLHADVDGDPAWLQQLFSNLLSNGIKYSSAGGRVALSGVVRGRYVEVRVSDDGEGIEEQDLERIFERYHRARSDSPNGFGLGLPIAQEIARAHGGDIHVESRPGQGTTFRVRLPLAEAPR